MFRLPNRRQTWVTIACAWAMVAVARPVAAQIFNGVTANFELSDAVRVDMADAAARTHLARVQAFESNGQWDEALDVLRDLAESHGQRLIAITPSRYVPMRRYVQWKIAASPADVLARYRDRVDPQAQRWLEVGVARRDERLLRRVTDELFCSSSGDDAAWALGELALERGDYGAARGFWYQLIETPPQLVNEQAYRALRNDPDLPVEAATLLDGAYRQIQSSERHMYEYVGYGLPAVDIRELAILFREHGLPSPRLAYPHSDIPLAEIRARMLLTHILEGSRDVAAPATIAYAEQFPDAHGRLGGRDVVFATYLQDLLNGAEQWSSAVPSREWPTFSGDYERNAATRIGVEFGKIRWRRDLPSAPKTDVGYPSAPVAESKDAPLSYHPVVSDQLVMVNTLDEIFAYQLLTGSPAWGAEATIFPSTTSAAIRSQVVGSTRNSAASSLGTPRFTMTVDRGRLFARMGDPVTARPTDRAVIESDSAIVALDLRSEGKALNSPPAELGWAFEGSPISDGDHLYVAMRRSEVQPQAYVACYDAMTATLLWRQFICAAETPSHGTVGEISHNLLTMHGDFLYYNTNLGAVAALDKSNGAIEWLMLYPRVRRGELNQRAAHFYRDLTPALYHLGALIVAPSDSELIFAVDAHSGEFLWEVNSEVSDPVHLLGADDRYVIASGEKLWWINVWNGRVEAVYPEGPTPKGHGRGAIAGGRVYWPTQTEGPAIQVFDLHTRQWRDRIDLYARGVDAGNITVAGDTVLITTNHEMVAFENSAIAPAELAATADGID